VYKSISYKYKLTDLCEKSEIKSLTLFCI